jgi:hypothetical protein
VLNAKANLSLTAMHDDSRGVIRHDVPPWRQRVHFQRIDRHTTFGCGELQQSQLRPIASVGDKFGVEGDDATLFDVVTKFQKIFLAGNYGGIHQAGSSQAASFFAQQLGPELLSAARYSRLRPTDKTNLCL